MTWAALHHRALLGLVLLSGFFSTQGMAAAAPEQLAPTTVDAQGSAKPSRKAKAAVASRALPTSAQNASDGPSSTTTAGIASSATPTYFLLNQAPNDFSPPQPITATAAPAPSKQASEAPQASNLTATNAQANKPLAASPSPASIASLPTKPEKQAPRGKAAARQPQAPNAEAVRPSVALAAPAALPSTPTQTSALLPSVVDMQVAPPSVTYGSVHTGFLKCEFDQHILLEADPQNAGQYKLTHGHQVFRLLPAPSVPGVVRMEDASHSLVWIQLPNKSMLLDQVQGQRLIDECANQEQRAYAHYLTLHPQPSILD